MALVGFTLSLWVFAGLLTGVLLASLTPCQRGWVRCRKSVSEFFSKSSAVNLLAAARVFLFGARDIWFVVGIPVYLYQSGWQFWQVGSFLAVWTIFYGSVQGFAPRLIKRSSDGLSAGDTCRTRRHGLVCAGAPHPWSLGNHRRAGCRSSLTACLWCGGGAICVRGFCLRSTRLCIPILFWLMQGLKKWLRMSAFIMLPMRLDGLLEQFCRGCVTVQADLLDVCWYQLFLLLSAQRCVGVCPRGKHDILPAVFCLTYTTPD